MPPWIGLFQGHAGLFQLEYCDLYRTAAFPILEDSGSPLFHVNPFGTGYSSGALSDSGNSWTLSLYPLEETLSILKIPWINSDISRSLSLLV